MHDYWNVNTSNDIFHFCVSVTEFEFQPIGFISCHFFTSFIQNLMQMLIFSLFSRTLGSLTENDKPCLIFHPKNKNIYKFYEFTIKTDFRNMKKYITKVGILDGKTKQNRLKALILPYFFKESLYLSKRRMRNAYKFFIVKKSVLTNFMRLRLKIPSEMLQWLVSLDLRTVLSYL